MLESRRAVERVNADFGWLESRHTFIGSVGITIRGSTAVPMRWFAEDDHAGILVFDLRSNELPQMWLLEV
jgi:hypothetical protein